MPLIAWAYARDLERRERADALLATMSITARAAS
jgi:hypothetical protein